MKQLRVVNSGALLAVLVCACSGASGGDAEEPVTPVSFPVASDLNPDPEITEIEIVAQMRDVDVGNDAPLPHRTFGGSIPGPLIRARQHETLIVHLENQLDEPTTIHWHGMRVPNGMDGVPGVTMDPVEPGDSFRYEFELLDAGTFWYHPHYQSLKQVGDGMYGAIVVEARDDPEALGEERVLVLSDISVTEDGQVQQHDETEELLLLGREGQLPLVGGRWGGRLEVRAGSRQHLRVLNTSRSRYFELDLSGRSFVYIGSDGGRIAEPVSLEHPRIVPGERAEFVVDMGGQPGDELPLRTLPVSRGPGTPESDEPQMLMTFALTGPKIEDLPELPATDREIPVFETEDAEVVELELTVDVVDGKLEMGINGVPFPDAEPIEAHVGQRQIWEVVNMTAYSHPFHMHGFYFQVLETDGEFRQPLQYKDTVEVPPVTRLQLVPRFDDRPGQWMFHCHILDHAELGMMNRLKLLP